MDPNPYAAPASSLGTPTPSTVSMAGYGVLCFITLWVFILGYALVSRLTGVRLGQWAGVLCLLASAQFASWRFVRTYVRVMSPLEFKRFALACIAAYWVFDELPVMITRFLKEDALESALVVLLASGIDVAIAAAIVYVTIPPVARYLATSISRTARSESLG
jgi:hypothetical protein